MQTAPFHCRLLHPRYWPVWLGLGLVALLAQLPFSWQMWLGVRLGRLSYYLAKRRRHIARRNIALCFPERSAQQRQALLKKHFETNGITLFEMGMSWFMPYRRLHKRFVIKGKHHWDKINAQGQGALIIGIHFNTLEIVNGPVNRLFNVHMTYRPHDNPVYDYIQCRGRERHNACAAMVDRYDIRTMVRVLKQGDWLWYVPDQDYGPRVSKFIPWFGIPAATVTATPRLLRMAKVPAMGIRFRRLPDYRGYEIELLPQIDGLPSGDDEADLSRLNRHIEDCIRQNPAEYLWVHRRFKTRPEGELGVY